MADETTLFELVSPERLLLSRQVGMVVVPGSEGLFGVLPRHAPLISTLIPGVIDVYEEGAVTDRIFIAGGFAEVTEDRCTVLAEAAVPVAELDLAAAERQIVDLGEELKNLSGAEAELMTTRIEEQERLLEAMRAASA